MVLFPGVTRSLASTVTTELPVGFACRQPITFHMKPVRERHPSSFPSSFVRQLVPTPVPAPSPLSSPSPSCVRSLASTPVPAPAPSPSPSPFRSPFPPRLRSFPRPRSLLPLPRTRLPLRYNTRAQTSGLANRAVGCPQAPLPVCCRDYVACGMKGSAAKQKIIAAADVLLPPPPPDAGTRWSVSLTYTLQRFSELSIRDLPQLAADGEDRACKSRQHSQWKVWP